MPTSTIIISTNKNIQKKTSAILLCHLCDYSLLLTLQYKQQTMFLNLKNKKYVETIAHQQGKAPNHPKTHRDQVKEKHSKEQKEIKSYRQHHNGSKKQVGSTAVSTLQPSNASFTNIGHQFKIKIKDHAQKEHDNLNSSQEKIDSYRLARVASAYKRIKRVDTNEGSFNGEDVEKSQERIKRTMNKPHKVGIKKQQINNLAQNYICVTEGDQIQSKILDKINSGRTQIMQELLDPFLQLFSQSKTQKFKERSYSHRDLQIKRSLDRSGKFANKDKRKKKSNQILIKDDGSPRENDSQNTVMSFISKFYSKLDRVKEKLGSMSNSKKYKYVDSPSINLFEQLYEDIQLFVQQFYEICLKQMDSQLKKYEKAIGILVLQEQKTKKEIHNLSKICDFQRSKSKMLERMVLSSQDKSLYSTIFLNELSFSFDVDSHLRDKLYEEARKNGLVSELNESQFEEEIIKSTRSLKVVGTQEDNLFDGNSNQFVGYNIDGFGNCIGAKKKDKSKIDNI